MSAANEAQSAQAEQLYTAINRRLIETGERERLKEWARMKLAESGWKDQVRKDCLDLIKKRSKSQMPSPPVEQLLEEVSQQAIESVPQQVKLELLQRMRLFLAGQMEQKAPAGAAGEKSSV